MFHRKRKTGKKILVLDFDGVLHAYNSGWHGAKVIADPPVPGAMAALYLYVTFFDVAIVSARSHQWGGRRAMKRWLTRRMTEHLFAGKKAYQPETVRSAIWKHCEKLAREAINEISFPRHKPPAHVTLDDRALTFTGFWYDPQKLIDFKPWNKVLA